MKFLTATRIAALSAWLVSLAALITSVVHTFPEKWQAPAIAVAAVLSNAAVAVKYLEANQTSEKIASDERMHSAQLTHDTWLSALVTEIDDLKAKLEDTHTFAIPSEPESDEEKAETSDGFDLPSAADIIAEINSGTTAPPASATRPSLVPVDDTKATA